MKGYDLLIAMGQVEDRFVEEAEQGRIGNAGKKQEYSVWLKCAAAVACLLIFLPGIFVLKNTGTGGEMDDVNSCTGGNPEYFENNTREDTVKTMEKLEDGLACLPLVKSSDFAFAEWVEPTDKMRMSAGYDPVRKHLEVDFAGYVGDGIYAVYDGIIGETGYSELEGNYVVLLLENETRVVYGHLQKIIVSEGESVSKGEQIAALGQTGMATGPCLSLRVIIDGKEVNPLK